jgi:hypothetical protein
MFVGDFAFTCCETFPLVSMSGPVKHAQTESEFPVGVSKFFNILFFLIFAPEKGNIFGFKGWQRARRQLIHILICFLNWQRARLVHPLSRSLPSPS